jgi:phosphatidylglycerol---prolipoprotein diacylglyceryl transferase
MNHTWIDPVIFSIGPLQARWYGTMYVLGFLLAGIIFKYLAKKKFWLAPENSIDKYLTWLILSMCLGARLFYVFIYNWEYYSVHLLDIFSVWKGGLSFHGATVGMCLATWAFARKYNLHFFQMADCLALGGAPALLFGRIGNFINGELYGTMTDSWVGVIFPGGGPFPRHPSQLYEAFLEGAVLSVILFLVMKRERMYGVVCSLFVFGYGTFRFLIEFFREPDPQLGYYYKYFTMGQILCAVMMLLGVGMLFYAKKLNLKNPLLVSPRTSSDP